MIQVASPPGQNEPPSRLLNTPWSSSAPVLGEDAPCDPPKASLFSSINLPSAHCFKRNNCVSVSRRNLAAAVLDKGLSPHRMASRKAGNQVDLERAGLSVNSLHLVSSERRKRTFGAGVAALSRVDLRHCRVQLRSDWDRNFPPRRG